MSRKNVLLPYNIIVAQSMTGNITSAVTDVQFLDNVSVELSWTGTPTGTFSIQCSNSYSPGGPSSNIPATAGVWTSLDIQPAPVASGSSGSYFLDLNQLGARYMRIVYTAVSGTGSLTAWIAAKSL